MKNRIVEKKYDNGKLYYIIQRGFWNIWWDYSIVKLNTLYADDMKLEKTIFEFNTLHEAEDALKRTKNIRKYRGIRLYPTIYNDWYYLKDWVIQKKSHNRYHYQYIYGNYEYCCSEIDKHLKELENKQNNRKYKRIIPVKF